MPRSVDFYQVLELPRTASSADITKSYRKLAMKWHPDKNVNRKEEATEKFKCIAEAYEVLSDPKKKEFYDRHGFLPGDTPEYSYESDARSRHAFDIFEEFFNNDPILQGFFGNRSGSRRTGSSLFDSFFNNDFGGDMFGHSNMASFSDPAFGRSSNFVSFASGGGGGHMQSKSVSTTTRTINGRTVTTTEEVTHHPDGTVERKTVTSNGDPSTRRIGNQGGNLRSLWR